MSNFKHIFFLSIIAVYTILFGEFFTRIMAPQPLMPRYVTGSPWGIRMNIPNSTYQQQTPETNVTIRINSQGMRSDREYTTQKSPNTCRIALFGDSFFMGYEVSLENTFAYLIEKQMSTLGFNVEVLNFSVSGFGTAESIIEFQKNAINYSPDIALVEWHATDPDDNARSNLFVLKQGNIERTSETFLPGVKIRDFLMQHSSYRWLINNSQLYSAIREYLGVAIKNLLLNIRTVVKQKDSSIKVNDEQDTSKNELSKNLLNYFYNKTRSKGIGFQLVEIPMRKSRTSFSSSTNLLNDTEKSQYRIISPMDIFNKTASTNIKIYFEKGHGHLTPLGNQLLTQVVIDNISNNELFQKCKKTSTVQS